MEFRELEQPNLYVLEDWFKDAEVYKWLSGKLPLKRWYKFVNKSSNYYAWIVYEQEIPVGQISVEIYPDHTASVSLLTNPSLRNKGYGKRMLELLQNRKELDAVQIITAGIEVENIASIRCFKKVGFADEGIDSDNIMNLSILLHNHEESSE